MTDFEQLHRDKRKVFVAVNDKDDIVIMGRLDPLEEGHDRVNEIVVEGHEIHIVDIPAELVGKEIPEIHSAVRLAVDGGVPTLKLR